MSSDDSDDSSDYFGSPGRRLYGVRGSTTAARAAATAVDSGATTAGDADAGADTEASVSPEQPLQEGGGLSAAAVEWVPPSAAAPSRESAASARAAAAAAAAAAAGAIPSHGVRGGGGRGSRSGGSGRGGRGGRGARPLAPLSAAASAASSRGRGGGGGAVDEELRAFEAKVAELERENACARSDAFGADRSLCAGGGRARCRVC
jgi:hypothetical protein